MASDDTIPPTDRKTARPHDALFKAVFARPEHAAAMLRAMLPAPVAAAIAWDTLRPAPGSFIDRKLDDRHTDLLYTVRLDGAEVYLYVLLEHQSTTARDMAFRMLEYLVRIWKQHRTEHPERPLPLIIPLLVSHAPGGWDQPLSFAELLDPHPSTVPELLPLIPNFRVVLEDLAHMSNEQLEARALAAFPKLALWLLRDARDADTLLHNVAHWVAIFRELLGAADGMEAVIILLRYVSCVCQQLQFDDFRAMIREQLPEAEYATMTIAEELFNKGCEQGLEKGRQEGRREGRQEGRQEGARLGRIDSLVRLLGLKFGELRSEHRARIEAASLEQLDRYIERVLTANSIDELLAAPEH